jgi:hypothetical protein
MYEYKSKNIALLLTCQQIHDEAAETFYSNNTFELDSISQELENIFQARPIFSMMRYVILLPSIWPVVAVSGIQRLKDEKALVRLIMDLCPAIKVIEVYVHHLAAEEAGKMWRERCGGFWT